MQFFFFLQALSVRSGKQEIDDGTKFFAMTVEGREKNDNYFPVCRYIHSGDRC